MSAIMNMPELELEKSRSMARSSRGEIGPFPSMSAAMDDSMAGVNGEYQYLTNGQYWYYRQYDENIVLFHEDMSSGNWKSKLAVLRLVSEGKEMGIPWDSIPNDHKDEVGESFMSTYQWGDSGDDGEEQSEEEGLMEEIQYWDNFLESPKNWIASKNRSDRYAHIHKDKAKHGKTSCRYHTEYGNYSMKPRQKYTNKKLRKEFFVPAGKSGFKKMKNSEFIF